MITVIRITVILISTKDKLLVSFRLHLGWIQAWLAFRWRLFRCKTI